MKFSIITLGCKVNQYDSQRIREALCAQGHTEIDAGMKEGAPGMIIINTCTVTHRSDAQGRRLMRRALETGARVIVTGCQAVVYKDDIRAVSPRLEIVEPGEIQGYLGIRLLDGIGSFHGHSRAFVKIQQGCDNYCSYCIIPFTRGRPVSRDPGEIMDEINLLYTNGYNEIVLTGINIGLYEGGLASLIEQILEDTDIPRIRISSMEPWTLEDRVIGLVADNERVCMHLHLSLQSGCDRILKAMKRPYDTSCYKKLVHRIRSASKDIAIGTDIIAGFPGEDDEAFDAQMGFLEDLDFSYMHVFWFSQRRFTAAATMGPQVAARTKKTRSGQLRALSAEKRKGFVLSQVGLEHDLIVTGGQGTTFHGLTSNYIDVFFDGNPAEGAMVRVKMDFFRDGKAQGTACG
ncbi:MAG: MiaB/RimO family radical SAM methylthiotransferase [Thermodesulfobacteriota bacterium]|nr:MiaB/RimO family radical SAM methylthiotransferase [Thermodesulfobacteriota bacterium]